MSRCPAIDTADVELYFYDELSEAGRARVAAHLAACGECARYLADLRTIRQALAAEPVIDAPPRALSSDEWSAFMRRLDVAVGLAPARPAVLERYRGQWSARYLSAVAAMLALVAIGIVMAARARQAPSAAIVARHTETAPADPVTQPPPGLSPSAALREASAEHIERSKLVVLGLAARDPQTTRARDWQYERRLAGSLLSETRLYRLAAQERGIDDVARVMRDLETVLLEASMSDASDRDSLERVQRLIERRGLVSKMQIVATGAGL
jgi:hypothetical protein